MAKVIINLPHIVLREQADGTYRPRFVPSANTRKMGYKGRDLKDDAGNWYTLEQALSFSREFVAELEARRHAKAKGKRMPRPTGPAALTLSTLFDEFFASPQFQPGHERGRAGVKRLAPATVRFYRQNHAALAAFDIEVIAAPVAALRKSTLRGLFEKMAEDKGLHTARGVLATISAALSYAERRDRIKDNPALRLKLTTPEPRLRVGEISEMRALIDAADAIGRPEIGDAIVLGLFTGQRQADRLALMDGRLVEGRLMFRQNKTGAVVMLPPAPILVARLEAMRDRRAAARKDKPGPAWMHVVIDETADQPFKPDWYRHCFGAVRAAAVAGVKDKVQPMPSLADFRDQDLRDTSVTWLANAGCTIPEICAITGHAEERATQIMKHYLGRHPDQADSAIGKLVKWVDGKGGL